MKRFVVIIVLLILCFPLAAQKSRNFRGKKRGDFFGGAQDYRTITKNGLQISFGPVLSLTKPKKDEYSGTDQTGRPVTSIVDPNNSIGAFVDIGMAHYRLKESRFWGALAKKNPEGFFGKRVKSNLFHRYDWGLGVAYIGGKETTTTELFNASGQFVSSEDTKASFYNLYLTARVTADRFTKIGDRWHLETGVGFNFKYNILADDKSGYAPIQLAPLNFQKDFMAQLHTHIGFNYKVRKGDYLTFGFFVPVMGLYEWNKAKPTIQWFSSNYYPLQPQIKWIHHFTKRQKGCNTPGSEEDRKRNQEYMQNN